MKKFTISPAVESEKLFRSEPKRVASLERYKKHLWETAKDGVLDTMPDVLKKRIDCYKRKQF